MGMGMYRVVLEAVQTIVHKYLGISSFSLCGTSRSFYVMRLQEILSPVEINLVRRGNTLLPEMIALEIYFQQRNYNSI